jgi:hypothetical protein
MRYHEPWGIWLFEDSEEAIKLDLRLRCQGYTVVVGEELDTFHLNWQDIHLPLTTWYTCTSGWA